MTTDMCEHRQTHTKGRSCSHNNVKYFWEGADGCCGELCTDCWFPWIVKYGTDHLVRINIPSMGG